MEGFKFVFVMLLHDVAMTITSCKSRVCRTLLIAASCVKGRTLKIKCVPFYVFCNFILNINTCCS